MKQQNLKSNSYHPYSGRAEACWIKGRSGVFYPGVKVENISFPLSISAAQAAVCSCLANSDEPVSIFPEKNRSELFDVWVDEFNLNEIDHLPDNFEAYNPFIEVSDDAEKEKILHQLLKKAVTPHSDFQVSALLQTDYGWIPGVNIEISAWSLGLCAERVAISRGIAAGVTSFRSLAIVAPKSEFTSPCGACRQVLMEWMPNSEMELYHGDGTLSRHIISHLLPHTLKSSALKK